MIGIYCIDFPNGKRYVGSSRDMVKRLKDHMKGKSCNHNPYFENALAKHKDFVNIVILEECSEDILLQREQHYIDLWWDYNILYNLCRVAGKPPVNTGHSESTKAKIGAKAKNRRMSTAWQHQEEIISLKDSGMSFNKIAAKLGYHNKMVRKVYISA
jgi:group I intron endonuclease